MTKSELIGRLQLQLGSNAYYTNSDFNESIQDGMDEIIAFSGLNLSAGVIPFKNNLTYYDFQNLLPNFLAVYAIYNRTTKRWLYPNSIRRFDNDRLDWETATGTPYFFCPISYRYVAIYKKPIVDNYGDMWVFYVASGPSLDSGVSLIPNTIRTELIEAAVFTDLYEQNQEWSKAGLNFNNYQQLLAELRTWVQNGRIPDRILQLQG